MILFHLYVFFFKLQCLPPRPWQRIRPSANGNSCIVACKKCGVAGDEYVATCKTTKILRALGGSWSRTCATGIETYVMYCYVTLEVITAYAAYIGIRCVGPLHLRFQYCLLHPQSAIWARLLIFPQQP